MNSNNQNAFRGNSNDGQYYYITVIFENRFYPFDNKMILENEDFRNSIYGNSTKYTYKTNRELRPGQVISIRTGDRVSKVLVIQPYVSEDEINFPLDKIKPLDIIDV